MQIALFFFCSSGRRGRPRAASGLEDQVACKPGSVPAPRERPGDGHSSGTPVTGRLTRPTRTTGPETGLPAVAGASSLLGLAPGGVYRAVAVAGNAVRSYRTLSPSPAGRSRGPGGQTALCGTFPRVAPAGHYPAPCFRGARTFLPRVASRAAIRPPDPKGRCRVAQRSFQALSRFQQTPAGRPDGRGFRGRAHRRRGPAGNGAGRP